MNPPHPPGFPGDQARTQPPPFFKVILLAVFLVVVGLFTAGQLIRNHYYSQPSLAVPVHPEVSTVGADARNRAADDAGKP